MRPDRVLIVDDDGSTRRGLVQLLLQAGYDATAVGTFDEARRIISATPPDLLITDIRLEAYNGLQLILNSPHTIPKIVITGFADPAFGLNRGYSPRVIDALGKLPYVKHAVTTIGFDG